MYKEAFCEFAIFILFLRSLWFFENENFARVAEIENFLELNS